MAAAVIMAPATGATFFYQWDLNQQLSVTGDVTEIHFAQPDGTTALVMPVGNGLATIPNILLQNSGTLTAYAYTPDRTLTTQRWTIVARQKAEDYVYTETEVKTWETIEAEAANAIAIAQGVRDDFDTLTEDIAADITAAEDAKSALGSAVTSANTSKASLETAINNANNAKTNADTARTNLQNVIDDSTAKATSLQGVIDSATAINNTLGTTNNTASTAKTNLETAINNASTAKSQLEQVITNAGTIKSQLSQAITEAATTNTTLNGTIQSGNDLKQDLDASNASAKSNIEELRSENFNSKEILAGVTDLRAFLGLEQSEVAGITVDLANKTFTRLAGAEGLSGGADFNKFKMYGGRKRCNVANDGTINCYYGDSNYKEDGSNGQVMVYQPKFYYMMYPLLIEQNTQGIGYHLRKANYYVSDYPLAGFKLHPAFYDAQGNEIDYILMGAYEGSIFDVSANAYILDDAPVMDYANDLFCSIAGAKPASGKTQDLTRPKINQMCTNRGAGWYSDNIKATSANQMLMMIEMGMMNMQTAIGQGVVSVADNPNTENNSKVTGGTSALGNGTGLATGTSGQVSVSYRGYENPWGNIWNFTYGVNIWGDGTLGGGVPYYATDFNFAESKRTDNYVSAGFSCANASGYASAIGYSPECDWMFIASECLGNSSVPVGDYTYIIANLNDYKVALLGGSWSSGAGAGAFFWYLVNGVGTCGRYVGGRLVYVPTATA